MTVSARLPCATTEWPTGNGKKLSSSQAQLGQATCLAVAEFLTISCGPSCGRTLYITILSNKGNSEPIDAGEQSKVTPHTGLWCSAQLRIWLELVFFPFVMQGARAAFLPFLTGLNIISSRFWIFCVTFPQTTFKTPWERFHSTT